MSAGTELAQRQQHLLTRSALLRASIADQARVLETPFAIADRVSASAHWVWRERAGLVGGAALIVLLLRPRRILKAAGLGWWAWRKARRVRAWLLAAGLLFGATATARD